MIDESTITAIAELAQKGQALTFSNPGADQPQLVFAPGIQSPVSMEKFQAHPLRKRSKVTLTEPDALIAYLLAHKLASTALFATTSDKGAEILAVIDYHQPENTNALSGTKQDILPNWGEHRATLVSQFAPEWLRWKAKDKELFGQVEFAEFLEDNSQDIVVPDTDTQAPNAATMHEVALTLSAKTGVQFASAVRLDNGQHQLTYNETIESKAGQSGQLTVPDRFYLSLPPFVGTPRYLVKARLKHRLLRGEVKFFYEIERPHKILEAAINDIKAKIEKETALKVLMGTLASIGL